MALDSASYFDTLANATGNQSQEASPTAYSLASVRVPVTLLNLQHPTYRLYRDTWNDLALLYEGGPTLRRNAERFLKQRPKEIQEVYQGRLSHFTYQNIISTGLGWYVAKLFKDTPEVDIKLAGEAIAPPNAAGEGGDEEYAYYDQFLNDCDRNGNTFAAFGQEMFRQALLYRKCYVLIDLPPDVQQAENRGEQAIEPYLQVFDPRTALNWQADNYGNLQWIVFHAQSALTLFLAPDVQVDRWYYFDRSEYRIYERRSDEVRAAGDADDLARLVASGPHAMTELQRVPVVTLELPEGLWLGGRVLLQICDHLNTENVLKWALFLNNLAMPVLQSDREFVQPLSETGFLQIGPNDKITWLENDGKSFELSAKRLECLREEIYRAMYLQAQGRSSSATGSVQSGYSKEMDMAPSRDVLNSFGTILRQSLQLILYLVAKIRADKTMDFDVRGLSYDDDPALNDLVAAEQVLSLGIQSDTFHKEVQKTMVRKYGEAWNEDLKQQICNEIDSAPSQADIQAQADALQQKQIDDSLNQAATRLITRSGNGREGEED